MFGHKRIKIRAQAGGRDIGIHPVGDDHHFLRGQAAVGTGLRSRLADRKDQVKPVESGQNIPLVEGIGKDDFQSVQGRRADQVGIAPVSQANGGEQAVIEVDRSNAGIGAADRDDPLLQRPKKPEFAFPAIVHDRVDLRMPLHTPDEFEALLFHAAHRRRVFMTYEQNFHQLWRSTLPHFL